VIGVAPVAPVAQTTDNTELIAMLKSISEQNAGLKVFIEGQI
jgi:hypothetical protein